MATYRQVYLIMRARDDASRIMRGLGTTMGHLGRQIEKANQAQVQTQNQYKEAIRQTESQQRAFTKQARNAHAINQAGMQRNIEAERTLQSQLRTRNAVLNDSIKYDRRLDEAGRARATREISNNRVLSAQASQRTQAYQQEIASSKRATDARVRQIDSIAAKEKEAARGLHQRQQTAIAQQRAYYSSLQTTQGALVGFGQAGIIMGGLMAMGGVKASRALLSMADAAAEFSNENRVAISVAKDFEGSVADLGEAVLKVAREVPVPIEDLQQTFYYTFSALDVGLESATALVRGFANEAVVGNAHITDAARSTIAMINAYQFNVEDAASATETLTRLQNMQFNTVKWGALQYDDLSKNIGKVIPAATRAGQEVEIIGGVLAFLTRQGLSAEMAATSAARAMELIVEPRVISRLEGMGVPIRNASGEMRQLNDIVVDFGRHLQGLPPADAAAALNILAPLDPGEAEKYQTMLREADRVTAALSGPERAQALQQIFVGAGNRIQARRFWDLALKNYEEFNRLTNEIINDSGSFSNALRMAFEEPAVAIGIYENRLAVLKTTIGTEMIPIKLALVEAITNLIDRWERLDPATKTTIVRFVAFAAAVATIAGIITVALALFALMTAGFIGVASAAAGFGTSIGVVVAIAAGMAISIPVAIGAVVAAIMLLIIHWDKVKAAASNAGQAVVTAWQPIGAFLAGIAVAAMAAFGVFGKIWDALTSGVMGAVRLFGALLTVIRVAWAVIAANPVVLVIGAIILAIVLLIRHWDTVREVVSRVWSSVTSTIGSAISAIWSTIQPIIASIASGFLTAWNAVVAGVKTFGGWIAAAISVAVGAAILVWNTLWASAAPVVRILIAVVTGFARVVGTVLGAIAVVLNTVFNTVWMPIFNAIATVVIGVVLPAFRLLWSVVSTVFGAIATIIITAWTIVSKIFEIMIAVLRVLLPASFNFLWAITKAVWAGILNSIQVAWAIIQVIWIAIQVFVRNILIPIFNLLWTVTKSVWSGIQAAIQVAWAIIKVIWEAIKFFIQTVLVPIFNVLWAVTKTVWAGVTAAISTAWNTYIKPIWTAIEFFIKAILIPVFNFLWAKIKENWDRIAAVIRVAWLTVIKPTWEGIKRFIDDTLIPVLQKLSDFWSRIWQGMANAAVSIWAGIERGIISVVNTILTGVESWMNSIIDGINWIIRQVNKLPDTNIEEVASARLGRVSSSRSSVPAMPTTTVGPFHDGGVVPGRGEKQALVLGGEGVLPLDAMKALGNQNFEHLRNIRGTTRMGLGLKAGTGQNEEKSDDPAFWQGLVSAAGDAVKWITGLMTEKVGGIIGEYRNLSGGFANVLGAAAGFLGHTTKEGAKGIGNLVAEKIKTPGNWMAGLGADIITALFGGDDAVPGGPGIGGGIGVAAMMNILRKPFPGLALISGYRPGAITATGNPSWHGKNRAVDIPPRMDVFEWIRANFGSQSLELIFSPAGGRQLYRGRPHVYSGVTKSMHYDHIHWAMANGGIVTNPTHALIGEAGPEAVIPLDRINALIRDAMRQVLQPTGGSDTGVIARDQYAIMLEAVAAVRTLHEAVRGLAQARANLTTIRGEIVDLRAAYTEASKAFKAAQAEGKSMSLEAEQNWIQAEIRVRNIREELKKMRSPHRDISKELDVLRQEIRVEELTANLRQMRTTSASSPELRQAKANLNVAQAELMRVNQILPSIGDPIARLLMRYEAEAKVADARSALNDIEKSSVPTQRELRIAEIELALAKQQLVELNKARTVSSEELRLKEIELALAERDLTKALNDRLDYSPAYYEAQEKMAEISEQLKTKQNELESAVNSVRDAELGNMAAIIGLTEATQKLYGLQPHAVAFFRSVADAAGVSTDSINEMLSAVHRLNRVNLDMSRALQGNFTYGRDKQLLKTGNIADISDRVRAIFRNRGVPLTKGALPGETPDQRIARIVNDIISGRRSFDSVRASVDRLAATAHSGGITTTAGLYNLAPREAIIPLPSSSTGTVGIGTTEININSGAVQITFEGPVGEDSMDKVKEVVEEALHDVFQEINSDRVGMGG